MDNNVIKEIHLIKKMLFRMGIRRYEQKIISQLLEFLYRYIKIILKQANDLADHANRKNITKEDVILAIGNTNYLNFDSATSSSELENLAKKINELKLPNAVKQLGLTFPDVGNLLADNFQIKKDKI